MEDGSRIIENITQTKRELDAVTDQFNAASLACSKVNFILFQIYMVKILHRNDNRIFFYKN
jgi:hypothetical protein